MRVDILLVFCVVLWCSRVGETCERHHGHHVNFFDMASGRQNGPNLSTKRPTNVKTKQNKPNRIPPVDSGYFSRPEVVSPPRRYFPKDSVERKTTYRPTTTVFPNMERLIAKRLRMTAYRRLTPFQGYTPIKGLEEVSINMMPTNTDYKREISNLNLETKGTFKKGGVKQITATNKPHATVPNQKVLRKWPPNANVYPMKKASNEIITPFNQPVRQRIENNVNAMETHNSFDEVSNFDHKISLGPYYSLSKEKPSRKPHHSTHRHRRKKHSHRRRSSSKSGKNKKRKSHKKHKKSKGRKHSNYRHYKSSSDYHNFGHYENNQFYPAKKGINTNRHTSSLKGNNHHHSHISHHGYLKDKHRLESSNTDSNQIPTETNNNLSLNGEQNIGHREENLGNILVPTNQMHNSEKPTDDLSVEAGVKPTASTGDFSEQAGEEEPETMEQTDDHNENGEYLSTEQHSAEMQDTNNSPTDDEYMDEYDNGDRYPSMPSDDDDMESEDNADNIESYEGDSAQVHSNHSSPASTKPQKEQNAVVQNDADFHQSSQETPRPEEIDPNVAPSSQEIATPITERPQKPQVATAINSLHKPANVAETEPPFIPSQPDSYEEYAEEDDDGYDGDDGYNEDDYDDDSYPPPAAYPYNADDDDEEDDYEAEYYGAGVTTPDQYTSSYDPYFDDDYPSSSAYNEDDYDDDSEYRSVSGEERRNQFKRSVGQSKRRLRSTLRKRKRRTSKHLRKASGA